MIPGLIRSKLSTQSYKLLKLGYQVAITSRTQEHADTAATQLKNADVLAIEADVKDLASQKKAVEQVLKKFGRLDVLIANVGVGRFCTN